MKSNVIHDRSLLKAYEILVKNGQTFSDQGDGLRTNNGVIEIYKKNRVAHTLSLEGDTLIPVPAQH